MRKSLPISFFLIIMILASFIVAQNSTSANAKPNDCVITPPGLVSWWPGEGNAADVADGNDGTIGSGTSFSSGMVGQAFLFDGVDGHINVPDDGQGVALDGYSQLTVDAWIMPESLGWPNPDTGGYTAAILSKYDSTKTNGISFSLQIENGKLRFVVLETLFPDSKIGVVSSDSVSIGSWSHIAGVWRGGTQIELYVNGVQVAATIFTDGSTPMLTADNEVPVNIGRIESIGVSYIGPAGLFDGMIDEVDIFNRDLNANEIQAIYDAGSSGKCDIGSGSKVYLPLVVKPRQLLFYDDFSSPSSGWPIADRGWDKFSYQNQEYEILLRLTQIWSGASAPVENISNYSVAADMRQHSGYNTGYGLIFERVDWEHFYLFIVFPDIQGYALARQDQGWAVLLPLTYSANINPGALNNRLEVQRIGTQIHLLINGVDIDSASDSSYTGSYREVGLYIETIDITPAAVRFDNFTVWQEGVARTMHNTDTRYDSRVIPGDSPVVRHGIAQTMSELTRNG